MSAANAYNAYLNNHYEGMDPKRLILMLYDGALRFLTGAKEGVQENNPQKRGENVGKVIAIVSELNASLHPDMKDEGTEFLRGLYDSILNELGKVSLTNDIKILETTERYISGLRDIWVKDVMTQHETGTNAAVKTTISTTTAQETPPQPTAPNPTAGYGTPASGGGYGGGSNAVKNYGKSFAV